MKRILIILVILVAGSIAYVVMIDKTPFVKVKSARLELGTVQEIVISKSAASVEANKTASLSSRIQGKITKICFRENQKIIEKQAAIELDTENLVAQKNKIVHDIASLDRKIEQTDINVRRIRNELHRLTPLTNRSVSQSQVDTLEKEMEMARKEREVLEASLKSAYSSLELTQIQLKDALICAPFDGFITNLLVEEGEVVLPGACLFSMIDADDPILLAPIDESDIARIQLGQLAIAKFDTMPDNKYQGKVVEIYKTASVEKRNDRTINIKIKLDKMPDFAKVGMSANVEVIIREKQNAVTLPTHLIYEDHRLNLKFVYVLKNGYIAKANVKTGLWNWDITEVLEGVGKNDVVVYSLEETGLKEGLKAEIFDGK